MEQNYSGVADNRSSRQEISHLLYNLKVHCCVRNNGRLELIMSQMNLAHIIIIITLYPLKLALASLTGGDRSIGIVR
jgi:hypothetical protein